MSKPKQTNSHGIHLQEPSERTDWLDRFILMMDAVCVEAKEIILLGDFNIKLYEKFNLHKVMFNLRSTSL